MGEYFLIADFSFKSGGGRLSEYATFMCNMFVNLHSSFSRYNLKMHV